MKILALVLCFLCIASPLNNEPEKKNLTIEFLTDCEITVEGLTGMFKIRSANRNQAAFRATQYYFWEIEEYYRGGVVFYFRSPIERDFILFTHSTYTALWSPPSLGPPVSWKFIISTTRGADYVSNRGSILTLKGPCESIRVTDGRIRVTRGNNVTDITVDSSDYVNFPVWEFFLY
jgi:hypothetical protein